MNRIKASLCVATVLVFAAALAAQNPNADPGQTYPKEKQKTTETTKQTTTEKRTTTTVKAKNVTLTGCLQAGTDPNSFTLTNVAPAKGKTKSKEPASMPATETYQLTAASGVDLKAHVGHKVTISGMMEGKSGTELARTEPGASTSGEKRVEVKTIKHVSPTCP